MRARVLAMASLLLLAGGCSFSSQPLEPLVVGSQRFFTLEWQTAERGTQRVVQGSIRNDWGFAASNVRLLVEAVGPQDQLINQRLITIGGEITPGSRVSFESPVPNAPGYRVRVFSYDWSQAGEMFGR